MRKYFRYYIFMVFLFSLLGVACTSAERPMVQEPAVEKAKTQEPIVEKPKAEAPTAKVPITPEPVAQEPLSGLDFKLQDLNQETVTLSSYRGKQPVLLFFWTTWCPFCRKEIKIINDMYEELKKDNLAVLTINVQETSERVNNFLKIYRLVSKVLLDKDAQVAQDFGLIGFPTYILIDKKGNIAFRNHYFPRQEYKKLISK